MAAKAWISEERVGETTSGRTRARIAVAGETHDYQPSPALLLQDGLLQGLASEPAAKWPPVVSLAFILLTCGAFWAAVALGAAQLF